MTAVNTISLPSQQAQQAVMEQARSIVAAEFNAVNQLIIDQLHSNVPLVENIGHYIINAGGKRLRPLLVLLSGGVFGNISQQHIAQAMVIEFIHTATLLHDDVVDISALRRGQPTANATWGNAASVLVGDFLYTRAFQQLVKMANMDVMSLMANTTNTIAEGEVLQLTRAGDPETTEQDYYQVINNKTAILFAAATASATILSEQDQETVDALFTYGSELGFAFQIVDDVLDYMGNEEEIGKTVGDDLNEGKPTLPLIYTIANGSTEQAELIRKAIEHKDNSGLKQIIEAVNACGAIDYCDRISREHTDKAKSAISKLPDNPFSAALLRIADLAVQRTS